MENIRSEYLDEKLQTVKEIDFLQYRSGDLPTWCPGCGYFCIFILQFEHYKELCCLKVAYIHFWFFRSQKYYIQPKRAH